MNLRKLALAALIGSTAVTLPLAATAQGAWPERPVKLIVPFAPGGSADAAARIVAEHLTSIWKNPAVIENRTGANAAIAMSYVAKSAPDGYNLLVTPVSIGTVRIYLKNPGFDPIKDLTPITQFAKGDYVIAVNANLPVRTLAELGAYARANPTKLFNGAGAGGQLLVFESFGLAQNFKAQHINYRGEAPALTALAAGDVQASVVTIPGIRPFLESGRVRALAIPAAVRSPSAPDIPTAEESGVKNFLVDFWFGLMAPTGTPADIRKKVRDDVAAFLARPETQRRFVQLGLVAKSSTPEEFARLIELETQRWVEVAKRAGIQPE